MIASQATAAPPRQSAALGRIRQRLVSNPLYLDARWSWNEGLAAALRRVCIQRRILGTPPIETATEGPVEIRVLTWRRDWINLVWALKSFFHFSGLRYPLYIHDGGLLPANVAALKRHFPAARIVDSRKADEEVTAILHDRSLRRCADYRRRNVATRKLFDFFLLSKAEYVMSIDSDIVFFRRPEELCAPPESLTGNYYNRDESYWYSLTPEECQASLGMVPVSGVNSGLFLVNRESIQFNLIERWLGDRKLFEDTWVSEQTLHALCSTLHGVQLLPDTYCVSTKPGLHSNMVCKHYPGFYRPLLYGEGMRHLIRRGFLRSLRTAAGAN